MIDTKNLTLDVVRIYEDKSYQEKVDAEDEVEIRDMAIAYATIKQGVDLIDTSQEVNWSTQKGRWFLGLYK